MVNSPDSSPQLPFDSNEVVSGNVPLGASGDSSPKLDMCQKNDGKKWWCSKPAIPNEKYCKRHIYKRRGYSRKNVAGEGSEVSKFDQEEATFVGGSSSISTPSARVAATPNQSANFPSDAEGPGVGSHVNNQNIDEPILSKFALEEDSEMNLKDYFLDFSDIESQEQYSLRHLFDNWPMEQPKYADWSKHSMNNIPTSSSNRTSASASASSSSQQEKPL